MHIFIYHIYKEVTIARSLKVHVSRQVVNIERDSYQVERSIFVYTYVCITIYTYSYLTFNRFCSFILKLQEHSNKKSKKKF